MFGTVHEYETRAESTLGRTFTKILGIVLGSILTLQCGGVPLTAPRGATISMSANPTAIPSENGKSIITVVAFKAEDDGGGTVADGTQIFFTTTVGVIEERVETENGIARATLQSNGRSGTATITATSGAGISADPIDVEIGAGGGDSFTLALTASPSTLGPTDFTSEIVVTATDINNNPVPDLPVTFSTSAGALASQGSILRTNASGQAFDRLTLISEDSATVSVRSGAVTGTDVTVSRGDFPDPIIDSVSPASAPRGSTRTVTITGQHFQPGATVSFQDGIAILNVVFVNAETLRVDISVDANADGGTRNVTVTNPDGGTGSLDAFAISNGEPICRFTVFPLSGGTGTSTDPYLLSSTIVSFDASTSTDPDGTIVSYDWDVGDGTAVISGVAFTHDYTPTTIAGDVLQVVLTVTDNEADTCSLVRFVEVP